MMPTSLIDGINVDREVRDSIGLGNRTEDDVDIVEDRRRWCFPSFFTVYSGAERKCMQIWKFAEVDELSKWKLSSWLRNLSNLLHVIKITTPTVRSQIGEIQFF
jgi:hypothetical protein